MVTIKAHYRVQEQLQELEDVWSRENGHLLGQTVLTGERRLLSKVERTLNEPKVRTERSKLVRVSSLLVW